MGATEGIELIGKQPDFSEPLPTYERLDLMIDYYRPYGHRKLTAEALATFISNEHLSRNVAPEEIAAFLERRSSELGHDVRAALCAVVGTPAEFLSESADPELVKRVALELKIVIEIRDRGIGYLAGRRGDAATLTMLESVLESVQLLPLLGEHKDEAPGSRPLRAI
jgi:hypothetical protein